MPNLTLLQLIAASVLVLSLLATVILGFAKGHILPPAAAAAAVVAFILYLLGLL